LLPKNLEGTLRHLDEGELARLLTATMAEHERRGLARSDAVQTEPGRLDVARKEEPATVLPGIAGLTQAQVNLVQAAFKAGVKRSAIARQFGISPKSIQKVLAKKGR
jgi:predicted DNA binding protein